MKKCLMLMNCFSMEYRRHLLQSNIFAQEYELEFVTTYTKKPDENFIKQVKNSDLIITQNVKNIDEYTPGFIRKLMKKGAVLIVTEFWRFNGYWPYTSPTHRKSNSFWYPIDEFGLDLDFNSYKNTHVSPLTITDCFTESLIKLEEIDKNSDISIFDFFIENHKKIRFFSDDWHPTPFLFSYVTNEIFKIIGIDFKSSPMRLNGVNSNRYRIIIDSVKEELGLQYEDERVLFFGQDISVSAYYDFARDHQSDILAQNLDMKEVKALFLHSTSM
tara:strand:+ start:7749 stop:8567 length:819 start_codon:yes stop_codon:yes gene_type:complete